VNYAWPLLELLQSEGEPTLQCFSDVVGNRICDKVYYMNNPNPNPKMGQQIIIIKAPGLMETSIKNIRPYYLNFNKDVATNS
jgi:hypothetical protein